MTRTCVRLESWVTEHRLFFDELPVVFGRHGTANVRLDDALLADFHCVLDAVGGRPAVRDLNPECDTFVNGMRVRSALLMPGDQLKVGGTTFLVYYPDPHPRAPAPPAAKRAGPGRAAAPG